MDGAEKEAVIRTYVQMWVDRDFGGLARIFADDVVYSECYGPEYRGMREIRLWIADMTARQRVLEWNIKRFLHAGETVVVEWFFRDVTAGEEHSFDGVSIIEFGGDGRITCVKEFESKAQHTTPYR